MTSPLKSHIGFWMRLVSNHVSGQFARRLSEHGVSVSEWVALREIHEAHGGIPIQHLATVMGFTKGAVSKVIEKLEAKTFIKREAHESDGRAQVLSLTPAGRKLLPKLADEADVNDEEAFGFLSRKERETLTDLLKKIAEHNHIETYPTN